jgi:hypothetical protein
VQYAKGELQDEKRCCTLFMSTHRLESCPENAETRRIGHCRHPRPIRMGTGIASNQCYDCMLANGDRSKRLQHNWGDIDKP